MVSLLNYLNKRSRSRPKSPPSSDLIEKFSGNSLRERRHEVNLTQKDLAELVGVSMQAVGFWEQGKSYPTPAHAAKLQEVLYEQLRNVRKREKLWVTT